MMAQLFILIMNPASTDGERRNAQRQLNDRMRTAREDVLAAYRLVLAGARPYDDETDEEEEVCNDVSLQTWRVTKHGTMAVKNEIAWMTRLLHAVSHKCIVSIARWTDPYVLCMCGSHEMVVAAGALFEELFTQVCAVAENHTWAQGFADTLYQCNREARIAEEQSTETIAALQASALLAEKYFFSKQLANDAFPAKRGHRANKQAYRRGRIAGIRHKRIASICNGRTSE